MVLQEPTSPLRTSVSGLIFDWAACFLSCRDVNGPCVFSPLRTNHCEDSVTSLSPVCCDMTFFPELGRLITHQLADAAAE
jgi:hypothetical protein